MTAHLPENLDLIAAAPDGIRKLRGLILELAVRGKLVPQDLDDEPARELLKRIAKERARLEEEGSRKKSKPMPRTREGDQPFDIPDNWEFVCLGGVLEMINGRAFKPADWRTTGIPIVRIQNLNNPAAPHNYCDAETLDSRHRLSSGDFLISWSGTPGTSFGAFIWNRGEAALNQHIFRCVQIGAGFGKEFLRLAINSQLSILISKAQGGVGLQHVTKGTLEALALPLPPLAEQHRIVAKVDELMALLDRLEGEQADAEAAHTRLVDTLLGTLTQSTEAADLAVNWQRFAEHFDTLFTTESSVNALKQTILQLAVMGKLVPQDPDDEPASELLKRIARERTRMEAEGTCKESRPALPVGEDEQWHEVPKNWQWSRLGQLVLKSGAGWSPTCELRPRENDEWGVLKVSAVSWGVFDSDQNKALPSTVQPRAEFEVVTGDFLVSRANTAELVARSVVVEDCPSRLMLSDKIVRLTLSNLTNARFINLANSCCGARNYYAAVAGGTSASMKNVSREQILNLLIPIPPLAEQNRIVAKVDELIALCDRLKADLAESRGRQQRLAATLIESALTSG